MEPLALPLHLGDLHPVEQVLVLVVAFGPFAVLGLVVRHQRKRADSDSDSDRAGRP